MGSDLGGQSQLQVTGSTDSPRHDQGQEASQGAARDRDGEEGGDKAISFRIHLAH